MAAQGRDDEGTSGGEEALAAARRDKAAAVRARGQNPFANDVTAADRTLVYGLREHYS